MFLLVFLRCVFIIVFTILVFLRCFYTLVTLSSGNLLTLKSVLDGGVCVDQALRLGWSALMFACSNGQPHAVKLLLGKGANPNFHKGRNMDFYIIHGLILCLLRLSKEGQIILMCYKYLIKNNYKCIELSEL